MKHTQVALLFGLSLAVSSPVSGEDSMGFFEKSIQPFLKNHCLDCHGTNTQEASIRFDHIKDFQFQDRHLWTLVHEMLRTGKMPPEGSTAPKLSEKNKVLAWINKEQLTQRSSSTRRLNRRELTAALKDLTGTWVDFSSSLSEDGKVAGFDTGVAGLQDAADSVTQMIDVTRRAVNGIRFLEPVSSKLFTGDFRKTKDARKSLDPWKKDGAYVKVRGILKPGLGLLIEPKWLGDRGTFTVNIPPPAFGKGVLRLKLVVSSAKGDFKGIPNAHLWVAVGGKTIDYREITGTVEEPHELFYELQLDDLAIETKGIGITLHNKVEVPYAIAGFENDDRSKPKDNLPDGTGLFRPSYDKKKRLPPEKQPFPFILLHYIEVESDYLADWPPEEWHADISNISDDAESAKRLLNLWVNRAWRRNVNETEQRRFLKLYKNLRNEGNSFDEALRAAFHSVLLSAPFRYLSSPSNPDPTISQHAIASRLSFMLVGSPPDDELRLLAEASRLREPNILDTQVDRLLDDPRSEAFIRPFVTQWLKIGQPITIAMDHIKKQDFRFGRYLKESMQEETIAYIGRLISQNRPAGELIISDWTMMNDILAIHYGYEGIEGGHLRKVKLLADDPRGGGILGHAGIQSMLCWMGDSWVIYRGAWTLRHILDDPPQPPPLEVPELIHSEESNRGKTLRELLRQHQMDSKCSVCHKKIDPLGFAFQNFDLSGRWRDVEYEAYKRAELDGKIEWYGVGKTRRVDTAGHLPRGEQFDNFAEFKELIIKNYQTDLVRGLMKNLMIYATGRRPDVDELAVIREIMNKQADNGYRLRDLIKSIIRSRSFLDN